MEDSNQQFAPADVPGQHDARVPGAGEDAIEAVHPPDGEHVGRVAAADVDDVLVEQEALELDDRPPEQGQVLTPRRGGRTTA